MTHRLLFLCTGNYYRSRFAEHWFNYWAERARLDWRAASRGIATELGGSNIGPISPVVVAYLAERGIDINGNLRYPLQVTEQDFMEARRVIALDRGEHRPMMARRYPAWADQIEYWQVPDLGELPAIEALRRIEEQVGKLINSQTR